MKYLMILIICLNFIGCGVPPNGPDSHSFSGKPMYSSPEQQGYIDYTNGVKYEDCPYHKGYTNPKFDNIKNRWREGWLRAERELRNQKNGGKRALRPVPTTE